ncbi:putative Extradiol ring-cleavage dioxygenase, class III enzyme, subunit B [Seiridium unicorne]|uniref:Extradiol ring-cleavage dioxygenase, class III enzyme, subunit B n=1 Tax=Seiridium unicorne TaxID=138068 RepID=A0ABR2VIP6_9PEZI
MTSTLVREENPMNMAVEGAVESMAPVHMFSHGSPMMLGEEHASADYWEECGKQALANGIEHVVMMGGHWSTSIPSAVLISANPQPVKSPMPFVHSTKYSNYELRPDLDFLPTITAHLEAAGIRALADPKFDWIHDTYLVLIRPIECDLSRARGVAAFT